jgi:hypothetical protein
MPDRTIYNYTYDVRNALESFQTVRGEDKDDPATLFYGVELEVQPNRTAAEQGNGTRVALDAMYDDLENFALAKSDSSIGNGGFEIVTAPATRAKHEAKWSEFFDRKGRKHTLSWPAHTCGMHVHMGRDKFSSLTLGKTLMFYNGPGNAPFIHELSGREGDTMQQWAALAPQASLSDAIRGRIRGAGRQTAVNINSKGTVEVRIFRGNVQPEGFLKNLESVQAIFRFCQETQAKNLSYLHFCEWLQDQKHSSEYTHLIDWAKVFGHIGSTKSVVARLKKTYEKGE